MRGPIVAGIVLAVLVVAMWANVAGAPSVPRREPPPLRVVVGAERWPGCVNPITGCGGTWGRWMVATQVLPRLMELDEHDEPVPSPLLAGPPTLDPGPPFTVTYELNPYARWEPDGTPITSFDVAFTWHAYLDTKDAASTAGYDQIDHIDTPDLQTVVITWKQPYADWADVLGGYSGVVLEAAKFTSTDLSNDLQTAIPFSGGPWTLTSFTSDQETLTRNDRYWDDARLPKLARVTFVPRTETQTELQGIASGDVSVIIPDPSADAVTALMQTPNVETTFGVTTRYDALWFDQKPGHPFADRDVRAAYAYAFDRQRLLDEVVKPIDPDAQVLNCAAWVPQVHGGRWCDNSAFADVAPDPAKVAQLMHAAGYVKDGAGIWAKNGEELTIRWMANAGTQRFQEAQRALIPDLARQGFAVVARNCDSDTTCLQRLHDADYDVAMLTVGASPDPSVTALFNSARVPSSTSRSAGSNLSWYKNGAVDALTTLSDRELDADRRAAETALLDRVLRQDVATLPLYPLPVLVAWRIDKVAGPVAARVDSPEGVLSNLWAWSLPPTG